MSAKPIGFQENNNLCKNLLFLTTIALMLLSVWTPVAQPVHAESLIAPDVQESTVNFAIITDYGTGYPDEESIAGLVDSWQPDFIITAGDNLQDDSKTYENVIGNYYGAGAVDAGLINHDYLGTGNFWPVPGNHDYDAPIGKYIDYFDFLPPPESRPGADELFYDFVRGPVHFFMIDSGAMGGLLPDPYLREQQAYLQSGLTNSTAPWKIVVFHVPAASAGYNGSELQMQWPFTEWGADFVVSGHNHIYERIEWNDIVYFTAGVAGGTIRTNYNPDKLPPGATSKKYFIGSQAVGAMNVIASESSIKFDFINVDGVLVDTYTQNQEIAEPTITTSKGVLDKFYTDQDVPSVSRTYQVSGSNLIRDIGITTPEHFEISIDGKVYGNSLVLPQIGGSVDTIIYVRLNSAGSGSYTGNIVHWSIDADNKVVFVEGEIVEQKVFVPLFVSRE